MFWCVLSFIAGGITGMLVMAVLVMSDYKKLNEQMDEKVGGTG